MHTQIPSGLTIEMPTKTEHLEPASSNGAHTSSNGGEHPSSNGGEHPSGALSRASAHAVPGPRNRTGKRLVILCDGKQPIPEFETF